MDEKGLEFINAVGIGVQLEKMDEGRLRLSTSTVSGRC